MADKLVLEGVLHLVDAHAVDQGYTLWLAERVEPEPTNSAEWMAWEDRATELYEAVQNAFGVPCPEGWHYNIGKTWLSTVGRVRITIERLDDGTA